MTSLNQKFKYPAIWYIEFNDILNLYPDRKAKKVVVICTDHERVEYGAERIITTYIKKEEKNKCRWELNDRHF